MPLKLLDKIDGRPDPAEFRVPASDTKGHSSRQWFRCLPEMSRQIDQMVQSKKFPYRTKGDILRHALHRHMKWLSTLEDVKSVSSQVDVILEIMRDEELSNDFTMVFEKLGERISSHLSSGAKGEAMRMILMVSNHIAEMPDGYWRDKYRESMKEKYGHLLKGGDRAKLGKMEE